MKNQHIIVFLMTIDIWCVPQLVCHESFFHEYQNNEQDASKDSKIISAYDTIQMYRKHLLFWPLLQVITRGIIADNAMDLWVSIAKYNLLFLCSQGQEEYFQYDIQSKALGEVEKLESINFDFGFKWGVEIADLTSLYCGYNPAY